VIRKPILSVTTPVYNGVDFIARCYNNLLLQTFKDWEWVIVDDGSTDGTAEAMKMISDERISMFSYAPNKGRGYARTKAIAQSRGEWVVIWDVDDMHFPDRLEEINKAMLDGFDFFCSYAVVVDNELNIKRVRGFSNAVNELPRGFVHPTMACRTEIAKEIGYGSSIRTGEDAKMLWILSMKYRGLWFEDALTIYQEDREVNLRKAIDCNLGHLSQIKEMFRDGRIDSFKNRNLLFIKYLCKLLLLNIMRLYPSLYLKTVPLRDYGEARHGWTLSEERINFVKNRRK
jgi:glycosyltransferase involved in cell wall biosynthesis